MLSKPLIMVGLMGHYWLNSSQRHIPFLVAMVFCWLGDIFLLFQNQQPSFFIFGLGAFLIGHVFYSFSYRAHRSASAAQELVGTQRIRFAFPIILAGSGLVVILYPSLGTLKIPVMIYAAVLTLMVLQALFRFGRTSTISFALVFAGAILFMISDSLLAINKFLDPLPWAHVQVMLTYVLAQFLIVQGIIQHKP